MRPETIQMFIAYSAARNMIVEGVTISNAYKNGDMYRSVHMKTIFDYNRKIPCLCKTGYYDKHCTAYVSLVRYGEVQFVISTSKAPFITVLKGRDYICKTEDLIFIITVPAVHDMFLLI